MKRKRILHILADLPLGGGLSESVPSLCEAPQRQGVEVCLATTQDKPVLKFDSSKVLKLEEEGVRVVTFSRSWPRFVYFSWGMLLGLGKEVRTADVVHIHSLWTFPVWWGAWLALWYKKTLVMSPRGCLDPVRLKHSAWKKRLVGWMDRWLLRRASVVHATCRDEKRWIQAFLECANARMRECENGECEKCANKHAPRTSTLVQSPNARLKPAELERGAVFRDGAAMLECANGTPSPLPGQSTPKGEADPRRTKIVVVPNGVEEVH